MQSAEPDLFYQDPIRGIEPADCFFYHCMDIPNVGEVGTQWDIRNVVEQYLGETDFNGKRVLDVGAASGFLSFEMEKRGAEVVSFDMSESANWNLVPHYSIDDWDNKLASIQEWNRKLKNAYWFTHEKLNSKAKVLSFNYAKFFAPCINSNTVFCLYFFKKRNFGNSRLY